MEKEYILLTSEILEKNGFKKDGYTNLSPDYRLDDKDYVICVNLMQSCDKRCGIIIYNRSGKSMAQFERDRGTRPILYIFHLQGLLDLCEINKKIIL